MQFCKWSSNVQKNDAKKAVDALGALIDVGQKQYVFFASPMKLRLITNEAA
jgi:hypothetical protein